MPKTKTKAHTFWCVVDGYGKPYLFSESATDIESIDLFVVSASHNIMTWEEAQRYGYTCQKFTITTKIK